MEKPIERKIVGSRLVETAKNVVPSVVAVAMRDDPFQFPTAGDFTAVTASAVNNSAGEECHIWDIVGPDVSEGKPPPRYTFDARTTVTPSDELCEKNHFGQLRASAGLEGPLIDVVPFPGSPVGDAPFPFKVDDVKIAQDLSAEGKFTVFDLDHVYSNFWGAILPDADTGFRIFGFGLKTDPGSDLDRDDTLAWEVVEDTAGESEPDVPECLIWLFANETSGHVFNAATFETNQVDLTINGRY